MPRGLPPNHHRGRSRQIRPFAPVAYRLAAYFEIPAEELLFNPWREVKRTPANSTGQRPPPLDP